MAKEKEYLQTVISYIITRPRPKTRFWYIVVAFNSDPLHRYVEVPKGSYSLYKVKDCWGLQTLSVESHPRLG